MHCALRPSPKVSCDTKPPLLSSRPFRSSILYNPRHPSWLFNSYCFYWKDWLSFFSLRRIFRRKLFICYICEKLNNGRYAMWFWSYMAGATSRRWKALTTNRTSSEKIIQENLSGISGETEKMPSEKREKCSRLLQWHWIAAELFPFVLLVDSSNTRLAFLRSFEIYFDVKCFLCCVSPMWWKKKWESVRDRLSKRKLRRDFNARYGNRQVTFIALVLHLGFENTLSTLSTVYVFCIRASESK